MTFASLVSACGFFAERSFASSLVQHNGAPVVSDVEVLTPLIPRYEKFEATFQVDTAAENFNLPYDANPPRGLAPGSGVTVDVLFSPDNWKTTIVQPAFWYQPVISEPTDQRNYLLPEGMPNWQVRFAPQTAGEWQFRIRVQDRNGTGEFPPNTALSFRVTEGIGRYDGVRVNPSSRHGFVRVSQNDVRYFEFQDGTPFLGLGYNTGAENLNKSDERFRAWELNGLTFARIWMSGDGINGAQEQPWVFPKKKENDGNLNTLLDSRTTFGGAPLSFRLDADRPCMFAYFGQSPIAVRPATTYSVTLRAKLTDVQPIANASNAGLTVIHQGWPSSGCKELNTPPLVPPRAGTTDWYTATGTLTTRPDQRFLDYLHIVLKDVATGSANIDSIALTMRDDPAQVNLLRRSRADSHLHFDYVNAAKWDLVIESAARHGVYLKIVADEKNEWIRNILQADGTFGKFDNNNFYAAPDTAVRWLQQAWWRYLIARWGYSTAIHSFEYVNEGDPYNGNHYNAAAAMAEYFDAHDPSQHMVTTSMWHSFPGPAFWANPAYKVLDYADLHAYAMNIFDSDGASFPPALLETRSPYVHSGARSLRIPATQKLSVSFTPRGLTLNEPGEWVVRYWLKANDFKANCDFNLTGSMLRVRWEIDGGDFHGGSEGIVPSGSDGKDFVCTSLDGTFDWREFDSQHDRNGNEIPLEHRLVIGNNLPHELSLTVGNSNGISGEAWIDDIEIISPSGKRVPVLGTFEERNFSQDTAWFTAAYSLLWGATSPTSAHKPLVRGEAGLNNAEFPDGLLKANQDRDGIWLHNFVWGQINAGGMYDLLWWANNMIEDNPAKGRNGDLYHVFAPFAKFMQDVPLNNGQYRDADAIASDPKLRVWGQRDDLHGRAHLWIQNLDHQWDHVIANQKPLPIDGAITLRDMPPGECRVEWWDAYAVNKQIGATQKVQVKRDLTLELPAPLTTDIAVQIYCAK